MPAPDATADAGPGMSGVSDAARMCLRLQLAEGVGPIRFARILREFGGIEAALGASAAALMRVNGIGEETAEKIARTRETVDVDGEVALATEHGVSIVCVFDPGYPTALRTIADPPPCLYVRGVIEPQDAVALAVVGSRHCTRYGAEQAERFAALAAGAGLTVVSGLARGADAAAHHGALAADGRTLAVLGCGLCHLYPPDAGPLAERIVRRGALVSEFPMAVAPDEKNFPRRNRIIAGLSLGVLVVEAARRSGALITARLANEYNREVFAVPGRVDVPQSEGTNELIQRGEAKLVTHLGDILSELGDAGRALMGAPPAAEPPGPPSAGPSTNPTGSSVDEQRLFAAFDSEPMSIDALSEESGLPPARVAAMLTTLQLRGAVKRVGGEYFERV